MGTTYFRNNSGKINKLGIDERLVLNIHSEGHCALGYSETPVFALIFASFIRIYEIYILILYILVN